MSVCDCFHGFLENQKEPWQVKSIQSFLFFIIMSFSLYGSLPPSKSEKKSEAAKSTSETKTASTYSLYSSLPPPETSQSTTTTTTIKEASTSTIIEATPLPTTTPTPQGKIVN